MTTNRAVLSAAKRLLPAAGALLLPCAWLVPATAGCSLLGWLGTIALVWVVAVRRSSYAELWLLGMLAHAIGFNWLFSEISHLSGQSTAVVAGFFLLFVALNGLMYPAAGLIARSLPQSLDRFGSRCAMAWTAVEVVPVRIFPWQIGHTQLSFSPFVQIADLGGVHIITFMMVWMAEGIIVVATDRTRRAAFALPATCLLVSLLYGARQAEVYSRPVERGLTVTLVQGSTSTEVEGEPIFERNVARFLKLTDANDRPSDLVIWPEEVLPFDVNESVFSRKFDKRLPVLKEHASLLMGTKTFRRPSRHFNSALFIAPDGTVPLPYHKQALIPFGEYIPFGTFFPWLRVVNPAAMGITFGSGTTVFEAPGSGEAHESVRVAPLLCYEDLFSNWSRDAVNKGAELLVSLSNDEWLRAENSLALSQHYMMSAFRSIEMRRAFLRVGTPGITAVIDERGREVARLGIGEEGTVQRRVSARDAATIYSSPYGDWPWYLLSASCIVLAIARCLMLALSALSMSRRGNGSHLLFEE